MQRRQTFSPQEMQLMQSLYECGFDAESTTQAIREERAASLPNYQAAVASLLDQPPPAYAAADDSADLNPMDDQARELHKLKAERDVAVARAVSAEKRLLEATPTGKNRVAYEDTLLAIIDKKLPGLTPAAIIRAVPAIPVTDDTLRNWLKRARDRKDSLAVDLSKSK